VNRTLQIRAEWLFLALVSAFLAVHTMPRAWRTLNTDFPNYYLAAQLAHEHTDLSHIYEWRWLQREKDHRAIDQRIIGLAPITPFSTLFVYPLTGLAPLPAKHLWLLLQLALLAPVALSLRALTGQPLRRIAIVIAACLPLHRNLLYGQFYILLLALILAACWAYQRKLPVLSGALIAIASITKIFPVIFLLYFLRKRDWRAVVATLITLVLASLLSIYIFGWNVHRTYLEVILPWTLRGETLPPYALASSSISTLLHHLFLFEPQWNPQPWRNAPRAFAILGPLLQTLILAPALLLIRPGRDHIALEWSALLTATLAISTIPASYNFTLLIFPAVVLLGYCKPAAVISLVLFLAIGYPGWNTAPADGLRVLLHAPRLFFLLAFTALIYAILANLKPRLAISATWTAALTAITLIAIATSIRHQHNLFADYPYRLPMQPDALLSAAPSPGPLAISLLADGYHVNHGPADQLSFLATPHGTWIEQATTTSSLVGPPGFDTIPNARSPLSTSDSDRIAYIRDQQGRGQLITPTYATPTAFNVEEAAALPNGTYIFAANSPSKLFVTSPTGAPTPLPLGEARYPAISPNHRLLAYSRFQSGVWNLWLLDLLTNQSRRLTDAPCNQVEPAWEADSKTILYASDCGRALGFTALCRRTFLP
jgi:hypothetical protein